ncbi:MAG TPA: hypothetical protein PLX08_10305 [Bacteroidales bacterium]|jgi:predicted aldo/keto reductase-like oxidoreductase|nr:hypothetical protein [Bacteroidales bacterium]
MPWNPSTVENTANKEFHKAFDQLRNEGKVKFCGICQPSCPYNVPVNTIARFNNYSVA